ncbi:MAG: hypothetical protein JXB23_06035 [Candidatus Aminicenantes bacterium]|nr:hypothetical protein [Candidatus Aminicenantes bacterium]
MRRGVSIVCVIIFVLSFFSAGAAFGMSDSNNLQAKENASIQEIEKTVKTAMDLLKKGELKETIDLLAEAIMMVKDNLEFQIPILLLCSEVRDYRDYDARDSYELKVGDPLLLYIEPDGYRLVKEGDDYKLWVSLDASIMNDKDEIIFQRINWVNYKRTFPTAVVPFYLTNRVSDIPAGNYTYTLTLKDHYKNTFLTKTFEFTVQ